MIYTYDRYWGLFHSCPPEGISQEDEAKSIIGVGYSGQTSYLNQPYWDSTRDQGCIPAGKYTLNGPKEDFRKGPDVFWLIPDPENNMKSRSGFMIHGDLIDAIPPYKVTTDHKASDGCIVCPPWTRSIFKDGDILHVI